MSAPAQESAPASAPSIEKIVEKANHQSPYMSAQGLKALKAQGAAALPALERFIARRSILALAPLVVDWLGDVPADEARAILAQGLANKAFPWRPQAARAFARAPRPGELDTLLGLSRDGLPAVREPALLALGEIGAKDPALRARAVAGLEAGLADRLFEPRLAASEALVRLGEKSPLPVLVEALGVERRFFDVDFGVLARRRAWNALKPLAGEGIDYDPSAGPARNAEALREVSRRLGVTGASRAPLAGDVDDAIFGIEIRSCRSGDQWVRLTSGGELVLGHYDLERKKLDVKEAAELIALVRGVASPKNPESRIEPKDFFGRPGCDFEKWYLPDEGGLARISVGLEGRPPPLQALHKALAAAVEGAFGPARGEDFRDRAAPFAKPDDGED